MNPTLSRSLSTMATPRSLLQKMLEQLAGMLDSLEARRLRRKRREQFARMSTSLLRDSGISEAKRFITVNNPF